MNRTDRLYALVEELRARAPRPVAARVLADRFEVSVRTIERDVLALQHAGVPIWSERGRNGGYALDPRTTLPPLNLTAEEATALSVAVASTGDMPFSEAARSASQKLAAAMSSAGLAAATDLAARIRVPARARRTGQDVLRAVEEAVSRQVVVRLGYVDRSGSATSREVEAHGLFGGEHGWYLIGWCRLRSDGRVFRLDRITAVELTDERVPERDLDAVLDVPFDVVRPSLAE